MPKSSRVVSACVIVAVAGTALAQRRPHDVVMREVSEAFSSLNENLDSEAFSDAAEDAAQLRELFGEIEAFWAVFETQDAIELARTAQAGARDLVTAAGAEDAETARRAYASIQSTCGSCHNEHREAMPDGTFRIKP